MSFKLIKFTQTQEFKTLSGMMTHILHQNATRVIRKYPNMSYVGVLVSCNGNEGRFREGVAEDN